MIRKIEVFANKIKVGTLALTNDNKVAFQYTNEQVEKGFSINPFKLPLSKQLFYAMLDFDWPESMVMGHQLLINKLREVWIGSPKTSRFN